MKYKVYFIITKYIIIQIYIKVYEKANKGIKY